MPVRIFRVYGESGYEVLTKIIKKNIKNDYCNKIDINLDN
jgi:hypothetical protein